MKLSFSWIGLIVFALPMLINIAYVLLPPTDKAPHAAPVTRWVEYVEKGSRIALSAGHRAACGTGCRSTGAARG